MLKALNKNKTIVFILFSSWLAILPPSHAGQLTILFENDGILANDGNYTNGFALAWESKPLISLKHYLPASIPLFFQLQHHIRLPIAQTHSAWGVKLSQRMWTPNTITLDVPQPYDRPYAGLLEIETHTADYSPNFAQKSWLTLGIIGPKSKAEQVQKKVHEFTDSTPPQGWQHQIEEQVTFQLAYELDALLFRTQKFRGNLFTDSQFELSSYSHIALGNLNSQASLGLLVKWGTQLNKTFGRLSSHFGHTGNTTDIIHTNNFSLYARVQLGYRFNDLTIEGNLPYDSAVNIQHEQAKAAIGINWTINNYAISWSLNRYTRTYSSDNNAWHSYGSLTLSCAI
ncbi:lipid A deacylase LpxR family protein [Colwellia piezophila]|uniref:lipid A deacylase LpxR family protein n=1 Tax=Colwellia piezophila TaxID=211668 RepID=UPI000362A9A6|nr:lipid A deacylase LpxR family protein [Colwellia piezophila]